jgi:hypothetical protein
VNSEDKRGAGSVKADLADYALADFGGEKIWIRGNCDTPSILIPHRENPAQQAFTHKMLDFEHNLYSVNGAPPQKYLLIKPRSNELEEVFLSFIRTLLVDISNERDIIKVQDLVMKKYDEWAAFFGTGNFGRESRSRVVGLIGELLLLEDLMKIVGREVIHSWWGPIRHRHDFEFEHMAFEVKSSIDMISREVEIHGLTQLLPDEGRSLYLVYVKIQLDPRGINVSELVERLISKGISGFDLEEKLMKVVVGKEELEAATDFRFSNFTARFFLVDDSFPGIRPNNLSIETKGRVSNISYRLNLDGLTSSLDLPVLI